MRRWQVSLLKVDCEGCEWAAIKSAKRALSRIPMIKIELVQPDYQAGNETVSAEHVMQYLVDNGFDLFTDHWNEQVRHCLSGAAQVLVEVLVLALLSCS